jgi:hypothetical protein
MPFKFMAPGLSDKNRFGRVAGTDLSNEGSLQVRSESPVGEIK